MSEGAPGRVALVTGAARGIGAATVSALCRQGVHVVAVDSCAGSDRPAGVDYDLAVRADLDSVVSRSPGRVTAHVADVRRPEELAHVVEDTVARFGRLDVAVAAAGLIAGGQPQWETPSEQLGSLLDVNLAGVWNTATAALPTMLASTDPGGCRFVAVASAAGEHGLFRLAAYNASKHAVVGLVRGLAADLVGTGVSAVAVSPGSTRTDMLSATAALYDLDREEFAEQQLIRRLIDPDEIAATIAFCCSPAGGVLNGSVVNADGGFSG